LKQDFGLKEKRQLLSERHSSTQFSIFWVVQVEEVFTYIQTGHSNTGHASKLIVGAISPHENNNKTGISRNFLFISTSISKFGIFVKKKRFI